MMQTQGPGAAYDRRLSPLADLKGVKVAAVVDADGLVVRSMGSGVRDIDGASASAPMLAVAARSVTDHIGQQSTRMVFVENDDGTVLLAPLAQGFTLVVVADGGGILGSIRYVIRESLPDLNSLILRGWR